MADMEEQHYGAGGRSAAQVLAGEEPDDAVREEGPGPEQEPQETPAPPPPLRAFPERYREPLVGMLYLGHLTDEFTWGGHHFVVRTLTAGEQIEAGVLIQPTLGTRVEMKAHAAAQVAGGLVTVDHQPLITPLGLTEVSMREKYVALMKWHSLALDVVYSRIYDLEIEARRVADALGEAHGQGPSTPG